MKVAFRADGGGQGVGLGHLTRCLAIAEALKSLQCDSYFICKNYPKGIEFIRQCGYQVIPIDAENIEQDISATNAHIHDADCVLIDSHLINEPFFSTLKQKNRDKLIAVIDDEMNRSLPVDIVIGNAYGTFEHYRNLIGKGTVLLVGPSYLPLRFAFQKLAPHTIPNEPKQVLVTMGGEDPLDFTYKVTQALTLIKHEMQVNILIGPAYKHEQKLKTLLKSDQYQLIYPTRDIIPVYEKADIAISAGGVTCWELLRVGVPMILIKTAENQAGVVSYCKSHRLATVIEQCDQLENALQLMSNREIRLQLSQQGQKLVDGQGAYRIAEALLSRFLQTDIVFRKATLEDSKMIWEWRNDPLTRKMSCSTDPVEWEGHQSWFQNTLKNSSRVLLLALVDATPVGVIRFDLQKDVAEISIYLDPAQRGKGLGTKVLQAAVRFASHNLKLTEITATIRKENLPSIKAFEAVGFTLSHEKDGYCFYISRINQ